MGRMRLGIFGGTFDPIHKGHLAIAEAMQQQLKLDRILFIPDYLPPHKLQQQCSPSPDRLAMTLLGIQGHPLFTVSDRELRRRGVSYTVDTLHQLYRRYHRYYDLYFLIGADSAEQLPTWHWIREAMRCSIFAAAARPGFAPYKEKVTRALARQGLTRLVWVDTPEIDISSTQIRQRVRAGQAIGDLVPQAVADYIRQRELYQG